MSERLEEFVEALSEGDPAWRAELRRGDPRREVLRWSDRRRCDLVALGTRGRTGLAYVLLGSVAAEVMRRARCDVLVARPPAEGEFALP